MLLFRAPAGSHLYGTNHPGSDVDIFEIHDRLPGHRQAAQSIDGTVDLHQYGLSKFLMLAERGVPQILEAMFTPHELTEVDAIRHYRDAFVPNLATARRSYVKTMNAYAAESTAKSRRHVQRLSYDLDTLLSTGRFDPTAWAQSR